MLERCIFVFYIKTVLEAMALQSCSSESNNNLERNLIQLIDSDPPHSCKCIVSTIQRKDGDKAYVRQTGKQLAICPKQQRQSGMINNLSRISLGTCHALVTIIGKARSPYGIRRDHQLKLGQHVELILDQHLDLDSG